MASTSAKMCNTGNRSDVGFYSEITATGQDRMQKICRPIWNILLTNLLSNDVQIKSSTARASRTARRTYTCRWVSWKKNINLPRKLTGLLERGSRDIHYIGQIRSRYLTGRRVYGTDLKTLTVGLTIFDLISTQIWIF